MYVYANIFHSLYLGCFYRKSANKVIWGYDITSDALVENVEQCLVDCLQDTRCFSVDYFFITKICFYNNVNDVEALYAVDGDWYEMICVPYSTGNK